MAKTPTPQNVICPVPVNGEGEMCHGCVTVIRGQAYSAGDRFFCSTCAEDSDKGWALFDALRREFDKFLEELKDDIRRKIRQGE